MVALKARGWRKKAYLPGFGKKSQSENEAAVWPGMRTQPATNARSRTNSLIQADGNKGGSTMCGHRPCLAARAKQAFDPAQVCRLLCVAVFNALSRSPKPRQKDKLCANDVAHRLLCVRAFLRRGGAHTYSNHPFLLSLGHMFMKLVTATRPSSACKPKICRQESSCLQGSRGTPRQSDGSSCKQQSAW